MLLPKTGLFENHTERLYLDCIANDGRSILDAVAIELQYPEKIAIKGRFTAYTITKVQKDTPYKKMQEITSINT